MCRQISRKYYVNFVEFKIRKVKYSSRARHFPFLGASHSTNSTNTPSQHHLPSFTWFTTNRHTDGKHYHKFQHCTSSLNITEHLSNIQSINHLVFSTIFYDLFSTSFSLFFAPRKKWLFSNFKMKNCGKNAQKHTIQTNRMKTKDVNGTYFPSIRM